MDLEKLRELIGIFQDSDLSEIEIEEENRRVRLSKSAHAAPATQVIHLPQAAAPIAMPAPSAPAPVVGAAPSETPADHDDSLVIIESPMVGVFYASPTPGDPPFVKPGDTVEENQAVCIVEAMKLMNEVGAKFRCTIVNVLVENGEPVEYNQPLFAVRPAE